MLVEQDFKTIQTFRDAVEKLSELNAITEAQYQELTGFGILPGDRKSELVGVPFLIVQFEFKIGKLDSSFVECHIITTNDQRYLLRDSSRGIHEQLRQLEKERILGNHPDPYCGIWVRKGLVPRTNPYETPSGEKKTSTTYYLS